MFGWLKRRIVSERRRLAWQNFEAAHDGEMKILCGMYGNWDGFDGYDPARKFAEYFIEKLASGERLSTDDMDAALKLNKGLRRLYDEHGRKGRGTFDAVYQPLLGWTDYFERYEDETNLIEKQRWVEAEIEADIERDRQREGR